MSVLLLHPLPNISTSNYWTYQCYQLADTLLAKDYPQPSFGLLETNKPKENWEILMCYHSKKTHFVKVGWGSGNGESGIW
jgi:hypothetical protein